MGQSILLIFLIWHWIRIRIISGLNFNSKVRLIVKQLHCLQHLVTISHRPQLQSDINLLPYSISLFPYFLALFLYYLSITSLLLKGWVPHPGYFFSLLLLSSITLLLFSVTSYFYFLTSFLYYLTSYSFFKVNIEVPMFLHLTEFNSLFPLLYLFFYFLLIFHFPITCTLLGECLLISGFEFPQS
jgi:hypothetical protein